MGKWVDAGAAADFAEGGKQCLELEGVPTVVCRINGDFYATVNICPHAGLPLGEGDLAGKSLTCPFHGYTYNVDSGQNIDMPDDMPLTTFPVKIEGDRVMVEVPVAEE